MLSIDEVARYLAVSPATVRRWVRTKKLVGRKAGAQWRFDPDDVRDAFDRGVLSAGSVRSDVVRPGPSQLPDWARELLARWRTVLENWIAETKPDHVIVRDRRGAKIWVLLMGESRYEWGRNLWHSTAMEMIPAAELRRIFGGRRVLVFDEMVQRGLQLLRIRKQLEGLGATVTTFVCIRNRRCVENGDLLDHRVHACEDLDEENFSTMAGDLSRLMVLSQPPLDPDHLVLTARLNQDIDLPELLQRLAYWGTPFSVRYPDDEQSTVAVTLDRPAFFDVSRTPAGPPPAFSYTFDGPCKLRLYLNLQTRYCACNFIVYPTIEAPAEAWQVLQSRELESIKVVSTTDNESSSEHDGLKRQYEILSIQLAVQLFQDFLTSGASQDVGLRFESETSVLDLPQLRATFGSGLADDIAKRVRRILDTNRADAQLFRSEPKASLSPFLRNQDQSTDSEGTAFDCRRALLTILPKSQSNEAGLQQGPRALPYVELLQLLASYSEPTVGRILDYEVDWLTIKPSIEVSPQGGNMRVWRGFSRGEFGPWFESDATLLTHEDRVIQRTLGVGPTVVNQFLAQVGESSLGLTKFNKLFANLLHDWRPAAHGRLYLGWRPNKYGPVSIVPQPSLSGEYKPFERFLLENNYLKENRERRWPTYAPSEDATGQWQKLYQKTTDGLTKAHISALTRLYAQIQRTCKTTRVADRRSQRIGEFQDPLTVLGAARNARTAYICGWFEVRDWLDKGRLFFPLLDGAVLSGARGLTAIGVSPAAFAEPAGLLYQKLEMYRSVPSLRREIEQLAETSDLPIAHVLLETVDSHLRFDDALYPLKTLEWACESMRAFTSFTRQLLTAAGFDSDSRRYSAEPSGERRDARFFLKELHAACPEVVALQADLERALSVTESSRKLTSDTIATLARTFGLLASLFESPGRVPDPRPGFERDRERAERWDGLVIRFKEVQVPEPCAVSVLDVYNIRGILQLSDFFGVEFDNGIQALLDNIRHAAHRVAQRHGSVRVCGLSGDVVILAGADATEVVQATLDLIGDTSRTLNDADTRLSVFGLFRAGISWCDGTLGKPFSRIGAGLTAYEIGDAKKRQPGSVCLTQAIATRVQGPLKEQFAAVEETSKQGQVFIRLPQ